MNIILNKMKQIKNKLNNNISLKFNKLILKKINYNKIIIY